MKKFISAVLVVIMVLSLSACSSNKTNFDEATTPVNDGKWDLTGTIFPLEKPVKFTILSAGYRGTDIAQIEQCEDWKSLLAATNVQIEFVSLGQYDDPTSRDNLQNRLIGGDYGDAIWGFYVDTLGIADIQDLASSNMVVSLDQYMTNKEIMPNFYSNIYSNNPDIYNNMKLNDGKIYYFAGCSEINAYTANEGLMQVNSAWLAKWKESRGVDHSPQTLDEFEDMLSFFKSSDLNGNSKSDEVPYFIAQGTFAGCMTLEHAMGMFGIATKDSAADMDIMIDENDQCYYVYTTDTYKEALEVFAGWYDKGYIWEDIFTANSETITNMVSMAASNIGLFNACENIEGFEPILPPSIEGYQAKYHMHPSVRLGVRQPMAVITDKCDNPEVLAAFMDILFNFDNYITWNYGTSSFQNGKVSKVDGKYVFSDVNSTNSELSQYACSAFLGRMEVDTLDMYNRYVDIDSYFGDQQRVQGYMLYAENNLWNPTNQLWPRCTLLSEDADNYAFKYTDVSTTLAEYRAKFVTGKLDIESNWDIFQSKLKSLGVEEMRDIIQRSYDEFLK